MIDIYSYYNHIQYVTNQPTIHAVTEYLRLPIPNSGLRLSRGFEDDLPSGNSMNQQAT